MGVPLWVATVLNLLIFQMLFAYMWPQVVLLDQPFSLTVKNSLNCMIAFLPHALAAAIVQILFWGVVILCMPLGLLLMLIFGFWFVTEVSCQIIYGDIEKVFHIEESIRKMKDAELEAALKEDYDSGEDDTEKIFCHRSFQIAFRDRPTEFQEGRCVPWNNGIIWFCRAPRPSPAGSWTMWRTGRRCTGAGQCGGPLPAVRQLHHAGICHAAVLQPECQLERLCAPQHHGGGALPGICRSRNWTGWMSFGKWAPGYPRCSCNSQSDDGMIFLMGDTVTVATPGGGTGVQLQVNLSTNDDKVLARRCACWPRQCGRWRGKSTTATR